MIAKLVIEGKEFPIEIQDSELQKLIAPKKKTGYERVELGERFYSVRADSSIFAPLDGHFLEHDAYYNTANYYSFPTVAENNARADQLMRQLRRFAVEHRENEIDWNDGSRKYFIYNAGNTNNLKIDYCNRSRYPGCVYFDTPEAARLAIETFKDELIWYFTEYKDSL